MGTFLIVIGAILASVGVVAIVIALCILYGISKHGLF